MCKQNYIVRSTRRDADPVAALRYRPTATTGQGLSELGPAHFRALGIARVHTRAPGKPPEKDPITRRRGETVDDVAPPDQDAPFQVCSQFCTPTFCMSASCVSSQSMCSSSDSRMASKSSRET